jgi:hypothetical protein
MTEVQLPAVGSRWVDTEGDDGEITVTEPGSYVVAENARGDDLWVNWQHFGHRYQPVEVADGD